MTEFLDDFAVFLATRFRWLVVLAALVSAPVAVRGQSSNNRPGRPATGKILRLDSVGDPLPESARWRFGTQRFRHPSPVLDMALSPDGKTVLTIGHDDEMVAWDCVTGKERWKLNVADGPLPAYGVKAFAFSDSSEIVYTFSKPNVLESWRLTDGSPFTLEFEHHLHMTAKNRPIGALPGTTRSVDITRDGKRLAAAGAHGVAVLDADGKLLFEIPNSPMESTDNLAMAQG